MGPLRVRSCLQMSGRCSELLFSQKDSTKKRKRQGDKHTMSEHVLHWRLWDPLQKKGGQAMSTQLAISSAQKKGDRHCLLSLQLAVPEKCLSPFLLLPACLALFTLPRNKRAVRATNCSVTQKARIIIAMLPETGLPSPAGLSHQTNDLHGHLDQQCWLHLSNTEPSHPV